MALWSRLMYAGSSAARAWQTYGSLPLLSAQEQDERYQLLGAFYRGTWASDPRWRLMTPDVSRNTRQIVKHTGAIVDCYEQLIYSGDLPTYGKGLPDGVPSAIPISPQTGNAASDEALLRAFYTGFDVWKWRQFMALIPKTAAIYGDLLVELVDDYPRGVISPHIINPWDVSVNGLELDHAGNIQAVAIDYDVEITASTAFGRVIQAERYRYRKEITSEEFRFYKDDKPFDYSGHGAVQPNPYGFVPAVWFRHELVVGHDRGMGAFERTLWQAMEMSSLLSSAIDYQRKQFAAPVGVKGSSLGSGRTLTLPGGITLSTAATETEIENSRRAAAENLNLLPMNEEGAFVTIQFDIGQTRELLAFLDDNLIAENPEAKYAQLLGELKMATGPGVRMTLAPIIAKVNAVASLHDTQLIKLCQMHVSMMGFRLTNGDIPARIVAARPDRYEAFRPYTLASYGHGLLDASIPLRDPFPESKAEKAQWVVLVDGMSSWGKREMGVPEDDIAEQEKADSEAQARLDEQLTGIIAGVGNEEAPRGADVTGPLGPTGVTGAIA